MAKDQQSKRESNYGADSIKVLRGLDPVKAVPGMYTRVQSPTHIIQEVLDNAADEALAGYASSVSVTLYKDGSAEITDTGRGIPVEIPTGETVPAVELVFTQLHSGGKFDKGAGGNAYGASGGLHGVGVSVTNALSTRLEAEVKRGGSVYRIVFADGNVIEPCHKIGTCLKSETGTRVRAWPDPKYFDSPRISVPDIEHLVRSKAILMPGVKMTLSVENATGFDVKEWVYEDGMEQYLLEILQPQDEGDEPYPINVFSGRRYYDENHSEFSLGEGAEWAVVWTPTGNGRGESYVNLIPTPEHGTHEAGLRNGLFESMKTFIDHHNLLPRGVKLQADDVWARCTFILSAKLIKTSFQNQTKDKMTSREALKMVSQVVQPQFDIWLNTNVDAGKRIAELAIKQAAARARSAQKVEKKRSSGLAVLPGKLTDCEAAGTQEAELFLVEGDSAGGSAKMGRNKTFQAILPLRGKVLNSWEVDRDQLFGNTEIHDISVAIGVDPHSMHDSPDLSGLRYGKINIMADADVDGSHIQVLLLTLFLKHFPKLISSGNIYIAQPPLFRIDIPPAGKGKPARKIYALDEDERDSIIESLQNDTGRPMNFQVQRFKGLGEMNPEQLWETTMCPDTRRLLKVDLGEDGDAVSRFNMLMSQKSSGDRREWIERRGNEVEVDV